jgi:hypothetical protein
VLRDVKRDSDIPEEAQNPMLNGTSRKILNLDDPYCILPFAPLNILIEISQLKGKFSTGCLCNHILNGRCSEISRNNVRKRHAVTVGHYVRPTKQPETVRNQRLALAPRIRSPSKKSMMD